MYGKSIVTTAIYYHHRVASGDRNFSTTCRKAGEAAGDCEERGGVRTERNHSWCDSVSRKRHFCASADSKKWIKAAAGAWCVQPEAFRITLDTDGDTRKR